ncbi:family 78 glycoside hydrolase catalytic domain [Arthrobacter sp. EH-1B-1]|uniref:alpha-L-rhamnosidase n=1 Tax=Arthrobacter vasquezii TaxID=2977629 RepID=A0ABT6CU78_9MICC|nr:alpha-L-rhamnosidase [Arthrobacter vasquezii]MDF9277623.1 family 78 glycoside hydrolase catalytic domain [Arthrobacter vasquezii]
MPPVISRPITFEHYREPLGIGESSPRISWQSEAEPDWVQSGYEIEIRRSSQVDRFVITSSDQILVPWPAEDLRSRESADARVRVTGTNGLRSEWSDWATVETGLLNADEWVAVPISADWEEDPEAEKQPPLLRTEFAARPDVVSARLYASAHGVYEVEINGQRVGTDILSPGWTVYGERLRYYTYDVTEIINEGTNAMGVWLADGWYRGRLGFHGGYRNLYGTDLSFIGQLEITYSNGSRETIASSPDSGWRASKGPIIMSSLYDGEEHDQRQEHAGWTMPGFDDSDWSGVVSNLRDPHTLVPAEGPPVRCTEEITPVRVERKPDGRILLDFGQNLVGRLQLAGNGTANTSISVRHAEVLQDGELYTRPLRDARSTDIIHLASDGSFRWEPRFTIHGFRYAEISGWPNDFNAENVTARVYHTDMQRTGTFECSDPAVNRLHENVLWSMRGNFVDIPTDCPQRDERLGWTGDIQVFAPTASYLYDCSAMLSSWLKDVAAEQLPDGTVPWYVPVIPGGPMWTPIRPGAVWGDVAVLTPWTLYERFGDTAVLERQYSSAKAWIDLMDRLSGPGHLWNTGFQLGDWLDPNAPPEDPAAALTDKYLVATAYFAWSTQKFSETAHVLGKAEDAQKYASLAADIRRAFTAEYVLDDGMMVSDAQTAYALAINFDLIEDSRLLQMAGDRLSELVSKAENRISTGFAGTPAVTDALTKTGHVETAYALLLEKECPSWLYTVEQGATTIWERWDSQRPDGTVNPGGMTSFNHYALGAVADWLHRSVAGIAPLEPGYKKILIAPHPTEAFSYAAGTLMSPYGEIQSRWERDGQSLTYTFTVPNGTTASVLLPGQDLFEVGAGEHHIRTDL